MSFFSLPKDAQIRGQWVSFMSEKRPLPVRITENTRVCSAHFEDHCFENLFAKQQGFSKKLLLKANSVPTIHPEDMPSTSQQVVQPVSSYFFCLIRRQALFIVLTSIALAIY